MEKLLIISHRGISSLQGLYICFRHSYTNASLPYVGFFGPVPTVGSHHAVPDLCIHIIKGKTLLFPWRPRICGGRDSVMLDRTTVIKMHGARGLSHYEGRKTTSKEKIHEKENGISSPGKQLHKKKSSISGLAKITAYKQQPRYK